MCVFPYPTIEFLLRAEKENYRRGARIVVFFQNFVETLKTTDSQGRTPLHYTGLGKGNIEDDRQSRKNSSSLHWTR